MELGVTRSLSGSSLSLEKLKIAPLPSNLDFAMKRSVEKAKSICTNPTESVGSIDLSVRSKSKSGENKVDSVTSIPSTIDGSLKQSVHSKKSNGVKGTYADEEYFKVNQSESCDSRCSHITGGSVRSIRTEKSKSQSQQGSIKSNCAETGKSKYSSTENSSISNFSRNSKPRKSSYNGSIKSNCEKTMNRESVSFKGSMKEKSIQNGRTSKNSRNGSVKEKNAQNDRTPKNSYDGSGTPSVQESVRSKCAESTQTDRTINSRAGSIKSEKSTSKHSKSSSTVKSNCSNSNKNGDVRSKRMPSSNNGSVKCLEEAHLGRMRSNSLKYPGTTASVTSCWDAYDFSDIDSASHFNPKSPIIVKRTKESDCVSYKSGSTITNSKLGSRSFINIDSNSVIKSPDIASIDKKNMHSLSRNLSLMSTTSSILSTIESEVSIPHYCPQRCQMPNWGEIPKEQLTGADYQRCCICSESFDRTIKTPLRLYCHHNACCKCVIDQMASSFWLIRCKICTRNTELPAAYRMQYLRTNVELMDELDKQ